MDSENQKPTPTPTPTPSEKKESSTDSNDGPVSNSVAMIGILSQLGIGALIAWGLDAWIEFAISCGVNYFVFAIYAWPKNSERFYDFTGMITFIIVDLYSFFGRQTYYGNARNIILSLMVLVWTLRLGTFLFRRILQHSEDKRFAKLKYKFFPFLMAWTFQSLWVFILLLPVLAVNSSNNNNIGALDYIGWFLWIFGFSFESIADHQKTQFTNDVNNKGKFINVGLWKEGISRHPNYFGEIVLWIGITLSGISIAIDWDFLMILSPIYTAVLLIFVSGIPLTEKRADEKFGGQPAYEEYKQKTPVLVPYLNICK